MHSDSRPALDEIFHAALERPQGPEREEYLLQACGTDADLRGRADALLLAHQAAASFLEEPLVKPAESLGAGPGDRIGPYKLLQEIGEGGMGVVYMAEQEKPMRRMVALKIIKLGMDTKQVIARFEAERQALALMDHPNIARVLDAGATDSGRPFFVMELVRGVAISEYCDKHQLSTRERMLLFIDTCHAVQHAHQKGIIHRDIKPGNVLVTSHDGKPVVKIIDFGVAKATNQRLTEKTLFTEFRQFIGTPEYMSPEQAEMSGLDVDTRTDIYSLGVLFYQLLVGSTPFDAKTLRTAEYAEMTRMIREDEPQTPSTRLNKTGATLEALARSRHCEPGTLLKLLRGDLDWIVMKAISKDRTRRYDSASALAEDVGRHLRHEPVLAGPPSTLYRASKLLRRNRNLVYAALVASFCIMLGLGVALSGYFAAKQQAERSNKISQTLTSVLAIGGEGRLDQGEIAELLDTVREVFGDEHATVAATLCAMGGQLRSAGQPAAAQELYEEALDIYRGVFGPDHQRVGQTLTQLGTIQRLNGVVDVAEVSLRDSLRIESLDQTQAHPSNCEARRELASLLSERGAHAEALELTHELLAILRRSKTPRHFEEFTSLEELLRISLLSPETDDLAPIYAELVSAAERSFPAGHLVPGITKLGHGSYLHQAEKDDLALPILQEALAHFDGMQQKPGVYTLAALDRLFQVVRHRTDEATLELGDTYLHRYINVARDLLGGESPNMAENYFVSSRRFRSNGRLAWALESARYLLILAQSQDGDEDFTDVIRRFGSMVWDVASAEEPAEIELIEARALLAVYPDGHDYRLQVAILDAVLAHRMSENDNPLATLDALDLTSANEATLELMDEAQSYLSSDR
ncbi:MAG: serine/threonine protein kinase/tetratricopeptide (TPR) repeat protein [Planctomycetota bacterium]|jgi:serine/threonine protein kinase/tetratricopeptide (TPR) repeat protein